MSEELIPFIQAAAIAFKKLGYNADQKQAEFFLLGFMAGKADYASYVGPQEADYFLELITQ